MQANRSWISLNDFPDELLLMIFQKLANIDVLYSLFGVNQRFTRIVRDRIFVKHLTFVEQRGKDPHRYLTSTEMLHRLCSDVLSSIANQVHRFDLESSLIKEIFHAAHYPNLSSLALYNINEESARSLFIDEGVQSVIFKNQIRTLQLTINTETEDVNEDYSTMFFIGQNLFKTFHSLNTLIFDPAGHSDWIGLSFENGRLDDFCSSTLSNLKIIVVNFDDCYHLFDGRFRQLEDIDLTVCFLCVSRFEPKPKPKQDQLPRMKRFSLCCEHISNQFEATVLPLLNRMPNLEYLHLRATVLVSGRYIDENYLEKYVFSRLPRLKTLSLFIHSYLCLSNGQLASLLSQKIEQISFRFLDNRIACYGDYFPEARNIQHHLYTSTCLNKYFSGVSNRFPGGRFSHVRRVSLYDEKPFEHEFFVRIERSFPLLEQLIIDNCEAQHQREESDQLNSYHRKISPIKYLSLGLIKLVDVHDHYLEEFLLHTKTTFDRQLTLWMKYDSLKRVTNNFTRDELRVNARKVVRLFLYGNCEFSTCLEEYFPQARLSQRFM